MSSVKYVALLAFSRIVVSYPNLVSVHRDVIMDCLEDADISIRLQTLELAARMVTADTLQHVVERLIGQLEGKHKENSDAGDMIYLQSYDERKESQNNQTSLFISDEYRVEVLHRILDICCSDNYSCLSDFEWYVRVLSHLVQHLYTSPDRHYSLGSDSRDDVASRIGLEIRNVAVRVKNVRMEATRAAESLLIVDNRKSVFKNVSNADNGVLAPLVWVVGEYAEYLLSPDRTLQSLIDVSTVTLPGQALSFFVQSVPKILSRLVYVRGEAWSAAQRSEVSLYLGRIIEFLDTLAAHPDLDVQERAIEFLEVMRLAADLMQTGTHQVPYLLSSVIPSLFSGLELNPVAPNAQKKVPQPDKLLMHVSFNSHIRTLFVDDRDGTSAQHNDFYHGPGTHAVNKHSIEFAAPQIQPNVLYQGPDTFTETPLVNLRQQREWQQRNKDDPFYISVDERNGTTAQNEQGLGSLHSESLEIDSIPIVDLKINSAEGPNAPAATMSNAKGNFTTQHRKYEVIPDEVIGAEEGPDNGQTHEPARVKKNLLQVDSSGIKDFAFGDDGLYPEERASGGVEDDTEMANAMKTIEKARMEMQRCSERVHLEGIPSDGTLVKKRPKQKKSSHGRKIHRADSTLEK